MLRILGSSLMLLIACQTIASADFFDLKELETPYEPPGATRQRDNVGDVAGKSATGAGIFNDLDHQDALMLDRDLMIKLASSRGVRDMTDGPEKDWGVGYGSSNVKSRSILSKPINSIPEPTSLTLLILCGIAGMAFYAVRRRRRGLSGQSDIES